MEVNTQNSEQNRPVKFQELNSHYYAKEIIPFMLTRGIPSIPIHETVSYTISHSQY